VGGALLATASWVRLADLGVKQPEAYVLPSVVALLVVGLWKMRKDPATSTNRAIGGPIAAALLPSWVLALDEPLSLRALIVGLVCALLVVVGVALRWSAPLVIGAVFGVVLVIWEAAPYVNEAVPRWALIGAAGAVLIATGITWEQRMQEARAVAGYVRRLR
jgi:cell division protein FtsW (lipid II flippase)